MRDESFEPWQPFYALLPIIIANQENQIDLEKFIKNTIKLLKNRESVYCGWGPSNYEGPEMVPLYGNLILLGLLGTEEAYELADRKKFYQYIMSCKNPDGSFSSSPGSSTDLRTTFSALFVAWILNIITPELSAGLVDLVKSCQTYEGGFSPMPNAETHGGYTYCAVGILYILNKLNEININKVIRFIADRQDSFSGGFNGRTGKLVDSCYCWWVGSPARTLANYLDIGPFWDDKAISQFLLRIVQGKYGGFCDHPPDFADSFHTLFGSAGLAVVGNLEPDCLSGVPTTETISSIPIEKFEKIKKYFESKPFTP
ncbi:Prenyltransferase and squalene oxidase repeat family protein [Trichomonas vaginalis G3]|uniref:Prenyltransferase and squalene oxidase repeat family protein n=1 Tax=Trichomonas vaginalis (strain ATCC PRA-98 / G3) TaxID=412133 RepID=A2DHP4_TRIV3|nr:protein farnesylation [Trichomonas vaginalis G3]EAY20092.1 Prenyltransferase and squalene oxidase repeat family protein [Trichomonas vaginalis G3]KAI5528045.1 protein farnesylation [Trichomonas vaginalis G3]|eukprot:XP_001581078.1 Prenyltransferase and squalene oxidase repeat family protein [Trichomonas vaginalis G3]